MKHPHPFYEDDNNDKQVTGEKDNIDYFTAVSSLIEKAGVYSHEYG